MSDCIHCDKGVHRGSDGWHKHLYSDGYILCPLWKRETPIPPSSNLRSLLERARDLAFEYHDGRSSECNICQLYAEIEAALKAPVETPVARCRCGKHEWRSGYAEVKASDGSYHYADRECVSFLPFCAHGFYPGNCPHEDCAHAKGAVKTSREPCTFPDCGHKDVTECGKPVCPTCKTELAFEGDTCGLCHPEVTP